jgi:hypothetical protein
VVAKNKSTNWTVEEDDLIVEWVNKHGTKKWKILAQRMKNRKARSIGKRWREHLSTFASNLPWTNDEDQKIIEFYKHNHGNWDGIENIVKERSKEQILTRFALVLRSKIESFSVQEEKLIFQLFKKYGPYFGCYQEYFPNRDKTSIETCFFSIIKCFVSKLKILIEKSKG